MLPKARISNLKQFNAFPLLMNTIKKYKLIKIYIIWREKNTKKVFRPCQVIISNTASETTCSYERIDSQC